MGTPRCFWQNGNACCSHRRDALYPASAERDTKLPLPLQCRLGALLLSHSSELWPMALVSLMSCLTGTNMSSPQKKRSEGASLRQRRGLGKYCLTKMDCKGSQVWNLGWHLQVLLLLPGRLSSRLSDPQRQCSYGPDYLGIITWRRNFLHTHIHSDALLSCTRLSDLDAPVLRAYSCKIVTRVTFNLGLLETPLLLVALSLLLSFSLSPLRGKKRINVKRITTTLSPGDSPPAA